MAERRQFLGKKPQIPELGARPLGYHDLNVRIAIVQMGADAGSQASRAGAVQGSFDLHQRAVQGALQANA